MPDAAQIALLVTGLAGQALFGLRTGLQWYLSERARESVIPRSYWWISAAASLLLLVYAASTGDPVFIAGPLVNLAIYVRNVWLTYRPRPEHAPAHLALVTAGAGVALATLALAKSLRAVGGSFDPAAVALPWLAVGVLGQGLWLSRFPVQWWVSELKGRSVLPPAFFWISTAGAILLCAYSIYRVDWVFILAYSLNPVPSVRNLILIYRKRAEEAPVVPASGAPLPAEPGPAPLLPVEVDEAVGGVEP